jgi:PAS domain S-box-containing protein
MQKPHDAHIINEYEGNDTELLELMQDAFFQLDENWNIIRVNRNQEKLSQTNRQDTLGKNFWEVFPSTADPESYYWKLYHEVVEKKEARFFEEYYAPLNLWTEVSAYPTKGGGIAVFFRDVTKRKNNELKIIDSQEQFHTLANSISQLAWMADADGWIYWYNQRWYDYTGTTLEEMQGWGWEKVHHPDHIKRVVTFVIKAWHSEEPYELTFPLRRKDGVYRWFLTRVYPVKNTESKLTQWIGTNTDITEQLETTQELIRTKAQLELTFQNVPADIFLFNKDGKMIFANDKAAQFMGYPTAEELLAETDLDIVRKKGTEIFEAFEENGSLHVAESSPLTRALKTGKSTEGIYSVHHKKENKIRWRFNTATPLLDEAGAVNMVLVSTIDITTQKEAERLILQSEEKFRTLAETLPQLIWITNELGQQEYASKRWKEYSGIEPQGFETWQQMVHPDDLPVISEAWINSMRNGSLYRSEARLKNKESKYRWHGVHGEPIKNGSGKIIKWIGAFTDIDDQKRAIQQKADFLSIASHELKTPVTSLKAFTQILQMKLEKDGNKEAVYLLARMHKQVDKLTDLIVDLLDATKVENGELEFFIEDFTFNDLVIETVEEIQLTAQSHKIIVEHSKAKIVKGDKNKIGQVITNLISNAIKYSPKADKIIVSITNGKNKIKFCVQDFGIGIANEKQAKVFTRFFRVSGDKENTFPGLGLGLFIASEIIKRHKGKISLQSEEGKGSTFCFTLPLTSQV